MTSEAKGEARSTLPRSRVFWFLPIALAALLVFVVRAFGLEYVFVDGDVVFPPADPQYHLRRAVQVFESFPDVLLFDAYINYPGGAPIPWPPLFDIVMGVLPRWAGADGHGFEVFAAWLSPLCALIACIPIVMVARRTSGEAGPRVPALALLIFALVPLLVNYSRVGMADHHAAVSMIGAWMLLCCVAQVDAGLSARAATRWMAVHVAVRLALLLTWHGSLLYLGMAEGSLALFFIGTGRRSPARMQAIGAAMTAALLVPVLAWMPEPLGGPWSAIALSRLHVAAMLGVACVLAAGLVVTRRFDIESVWGRGASLVVAAIGFVALLLAWPGPREGLAPALEFLTMSDGVGDVTGEQLPIFDFGARRAIKPFALVWGWWAPLLPLAPIGVWLASRRSPEGSAARAGAWMLICWTTVFGALAISQRRYGNDFGPAAAVSLALGFVWLGEFVATRFAPESRRSRPATAVAVILIVVTGWPAIARVHAPRARSTWLASQGHAGVLYEARHGIAITLTRFLREVRVRTPETSGYHGDGGEPEYGIVAHPNLGHAIQYEARRPTATDPFWAYIGRENWARTERFMAAADETEALAVAAELDGRYVITQRQMPRGSVMQRLHARDGSVAPGRHVRDGSVPPGAVALGHFRLVTESPVGGPAMGEVFDVGPRRARPGPPYKLWEIVAGAELAFACAPGERAEVKIEMITPRQRQFEWRSITRADDTGRVTLRVPHATRRPRQRAGSHTVALGPAAVSCGETRWPVQIPEVAVIEGRRIETAP